MRGLEQKSREPGPPPLPALGSWMDPGPSQQVSPLGNAKEKLAGGGKRCSWALEGKRRSPVDMEHVRGGRV